jgi:hypothetical protein
MGRWGNNKKKKQCGKSGQKTVEMEREEEGGE